jgi:tetratricopeptide (TPR) repeat protein
VPVDRDQTLKTAEKLLKQGKVADAITEYVRLVDDKPSDWTSVNALGDLYLKSGQVERAAEQFTRAADHLYGEGFFPRASAVYKKVLKVRSADDHALWQLADIAARNRLSLDARSYYGRLMHDRRAAGNEPGVVDCVIRLGLLDDASADAKRTAARALVERGESQRAARLILSIADALTNDGRVPEAYAALNEAAQLDPQDRDIQLKIAAAAPAATPESAPSPGPPPAPLEELPPAAVETVAPLEEMVRPLEKLPDEPLPLESFFEELRGKVTRDQEVRARGQIEGALNHLAENRPVDAIADLEEAARNPVLRFEASSQLARVHMSRGDLAASVECMERALEAPAPTPEERLALMYDLANTSAVQGDASRALATFMEIDSESPGYRDVRERIAHLSQTEIGKP